MDRPGYKILPQLAQRSDLGWALAELPIGGTRQQGLKNKDHRIGLKKQGQRIRAYRTGLI